MEHLNLSRNEMAMCALLAFLRINSEWIDYSVEAVEVHTVRLTGLDGIDTYDSDKFCEK